MYIQKSTLRPAGGFQITEGGPSFSLVKRRIMQKWRTVVKKVILNKRAKKRRDLRVEHMLFACALEWNTYACPDYQAWPSLTPLEKQQALFAWILRQKGKSAVDIIASGIAGDLYNTLKPQPRHDAYAHAVSVARPIWFLLRREWRTYEHDNGHGVVTTKKVWINKKVRLRSRNACQRIEAAIRVHCNWFMREYHEKLVKELHKKNLL